MINSDLSETSQCNIKGLSVREVMRIENIKLNSIDILTASPHASVRNVWKHKRRNCNLILGLQRLTL